MKKKLAIILAAALVLSISSVTAFAAATPKDSDASIEFRDGGIIIIDPEVNPLPGYEDFKSINMDFGIRKITGSTETYPSIKSGSQTGAKPEEHAGTAQPIGLLLVDARGKDGIWGITVKGSKFKAGATDTLKGYTISLVHDGTLKGPAGVTPAVAKGTLALPVVINEAGTPQPIFDSAATGSAGTWGANWDAKIEVLASTATAAAHKATITWGITVTP